MECENHRRGNRIGFIGADKFPNGLHSSFFLFTLRPPIRGRELIYFGKFENRFYRCNKHDELRSRQTPLLESQGVILFDPDSYSLFDCHMTSYAVRKSKKVTGRPVGECE